MSPLIRIYCLLAGACDAATGCLLVLAPELTLRLMGLSGLPAEPVYLRFIGAFVAGVGCSYLYPFVLDRLRPHAGRRDARLTVVLEATALIRLGIASFLGWALLSGALVPGWALVAATDLVLGAGQLWLLRRLETAHGH